MKHISTVLVLACLTTALRSQDHCSTPATIVPGVECNLTSTGAGLLLPCTSPIGYYFLPVGTSLLIDYTPSSCVSICQQGMASDIFCAQVEGGEFLVLCAGQSIAIGGSSLPGSTYAWEPAAYISCTDCPVAVVSPPSDAIYIRTETVPGGGVVTTFYNVDVITCTGTEAPEAAQIRLSPVPATEQVRVENIDFERFAVIDVRGRTVLSGSGCAENTIRTETLAPGVYFLRLLAGSKTAALKFLID